MSRSGDGYRDLPYRGRGGVGAGGGGGERWDSERFAVERDRARFTGGRGGELEERDSRFASKVSFGGQVRDRSVDDGYERRGGPQRFEDDRYERRTYYDDEPRLEPERRKGRDRGQSIAMEKDRVREREYSPSPPRRGPSGRPTFLRRQSSLDTFDRKPLTRFAPPAREEYGPPARYVPEVRPVPMTPIPLPRSRGLGPPPSRRYAERDYYNEIEIAEPDLYGDDGYRGAPERIREREIIRRRRRSKSGESRHSHSKRGHSHRGSVRSESVSSESSASSTEVSVRSEFPKKGKTRMPARLVSKRALIDLSYPFEEEGETIIIMKALGRENIDEVIKLSEDYKTNETDHVHETTLTTYLVGPEAQMSGARSEAGTVVEERHEHFTIPPPPAPPIVHASPPPAVVFAPPPPPAPVEVVRDTKIVEHFPAHYERPAPHGYERGPVIHDASPREETTFVERRRSFVEHSNAIPVGSLALVPSHQHHRDERSIRAEIKALEAEKEALKAEKRAEHEMRKADRIRRGGARHSETDLVLYERDSYQAHGEEYTVVRKERIEREDDGGVKIQKDKKVPPPRLIRAMLKTLT